MNIVPIKKIKKDISVRHILNGYYDFTPPNNKLIRPFDHLLNLPRFYINAKIGDR